MEFGDDMIGFFGVGFVYGVFVGGVDCVDEGICDVGEDDVVFVFV